MTDMTIDHLFSKKMAVKMILFWISLVLSVIGSNAAGEFTVLHSPDSLRFSGSSKTLESLLKEIFSASLGLSVEVNSEWNGLTVINPFNTPEAIVEVYIEGISSLPSIADSKSRSYSLIVDEYEPDTYNEVSHRIRQRFTNHASKLVNVPLSDLNKLSSIFGDISPKVPKRTLQHLKYSVEEDYQFLAELEALKAVAAKVKAGAVRPDNVADFYNFRFQSLHALSDYHGPNSMQTKEAKRLLGDALEELNRAFVKAYDGSVLVTAVSTDVAHTRRVRDVSDSEAPSSNLVYGAHQDYPVIFNILLWFSVAMAFTMMAIVYAIMDMDPGRDSIIYRMTSMKMKKDN